LTPRPWLRTYADGLVHYLAVDHAAEFTLCGISDRKGDGSSHEFVEGVDLIGDECADCRARREAGAEVFMAEVVAAV